VRACRKTGDSARITDSPPTIPIRAAEPSPRARGRGSIAPPAIPQWLSQAIPGPFLEIAHAIIPEKFRTEDDRRRVHPEDIAVGLAVLLVCSLSPNADGSLPQARIKAVWKQLISEGFTERAWDHDRWASIRGLFTVLGWIDWTDNTYRVGVTIDGVYLKGQACRFQPSQTLLTLLGSVQSQIEQGTEIPQGTGTGPRERTLGAVLPEGLVRRPGGHLAVWRYAVQRPRFLGFIDVGERKAV
jgi:hypothetical protein